METHYDFLVIGGGIVGLATAVELGSCFPHKKIAVVEKEAKLAMHQTGHNSGVIHSGIYYRPGSLKAKMSVAGATRMKQFCQEHHVPMNVIGKVIVATQISELEKLEEVYQRGLANGVPGLELINHERLAEIEPYVKGIQAIWVPSTAIVDYVAVCHKFAAIIKDRGGTIFLDEKVTHIEVKDEEVQVHTNRGIHHSRYLLNCAGLHSDKVARLAGQEPQVRIIPFRGEYYQLLPEKEYLVRGLVYPVPDPAFPFLGVHFTRMIHGGVEVGPNAVLAFKREGYHKTSFSFADTWGALTYPGFWKMARKYWQRGMSEMLRSFSKKLFVTDAKVLIPQLAEDDFTPHEAGVRAQALDNAGNLADDFVLETSHNIIHVLNAPSPAATASLVIGQNIVAIAKEKWNC